MISEVLGKAVLSSMSNKKTRGGIVMMLLSIAMLPILVVCCIFSGNSDDSKGDNYQRAFDEIGCDVKYSYQLDSIRFLDSYISGDEEDSVNQIKQRMEASYFHIVQGADTISKKKCFMWEDNQLIDDLIKTYKIDRKYKKEMLESLSQIRNGRENLRYPIDGTIVSRFSENQTGLIMEYISKKEVKATASGVVKSVVQNAKKFNYGDKTYNYGLTVKIEHELRRQINKEGEYETEILFSTYTNLKNIKIKEGQEIKQGSFIGTMEKDFLLFQLSNKDGVVNPSLYIYDALESANNYTEVLSADVLGYKGYIETYMDEIKMPKEYLNAILCIMQIESEGKGTDPMQSSECPENKYYPNRPNSITDPYYSIQCGIRYFYTCIKNADVKNAVDHKKMLLAAQGYNYGNGYIGWAQLRGGYSKENALQFSKEQAISHGWASYGDPNYAQKFLAIYTKGTIANAGNLRFIFPMDKYKTLSAAYGMYDPFGTGSHMHWGIDLPAPTGTPYRACEAGVVTFAGYNESGGLMVMIKHNATYTTLYDHSNAISVKVGQQVQKGQVIGEVGTTGNVTGPHVHLELRKTINGVMKRIDILPYLNK